MATAENYPPFKADFDRLLTPYQKRPAIFRRVAGDLVKLIDDLTAWVLKALEKHASVSVLGM